MPSSTLLGLAVLFTGTTSCIINVSFSSGENTCLNFEKILVKNELSSGIGGAGNSVETAGSSGEFSIEVSSDSGSISSSSFVSRFGGSSAS